MKKTVLDIAVTGKTVLVRVDFNVPHKGAEISDDNRIRAAVPTIVELLKKDAKVVLFSHLGKVAWKKLKKGEATQEDIDKQMKKNDLEIVVAPLAKLLSEAMGKTVNVFFAKENRGESLKAAVAALKNGEVLVMQNTRYQPGEEKNDPELAAEWASLADAFVMDAFGSAHRAHASTVGVPQILKEQGKETAVGFLMEKEIVGLGRCVNPTEEQRPYIAILGGAKVSSKIEVIDSLLKKCDMILIGGGMGYTFKKAVFHIDVAKSLCEDDQLDYAKQCFDTGKIKLSLDSIVAKGYDFENPEKKVEDIKYIDNNETDFPEGYEGIDVGPLTREFYAKEIAKAKTIFWNGPMGVFENEDFQEGTKAVCEACAQATKNGAFTVIGGGDSAAAAKKFGYSNSFSHVSTGGGASLELIQYDGKLPGIDVIEDK